MRSVGRRGAGLGRTAVDTVGPGKGRKGGAAQVSLSRAGIRRPGGLCSLDHDVGLLRVGHFGKSAGSMTSAELWSAKCSGPESCGHDPLLRAQPPPQLRGVASSIRLPGLQDGSDSLQVSSPPFSPWQQTSERPALARRNVSREVRSRPPAATAASVPFPITTSPTAGKTID